MSTTTAADWPLDVAPRRWQEDTFPKALGAMRARKHAVIQAATGSGKSYLLAAIARAVTESERFPADGCVVVSTPTEGLVRQLSATFVDVGVRDVGVFYGRRKQPTARVIVACTPSMRALAEELRLLGRRVVAWLADECHRSLASEAAAEMIGLLSPATRLGVTATPWRTDEPIPGWEPPLLVQYDIRDAIRDGAILPPRVVHWSGAGGEADTDEVTLRLLRDTVPLDQLFPVVVSAFSITDAEAYAERLTNEWAPALALHSKLKQDEADRRIEALRTGEIRAVVHCKMLVEGADYRWLRAIALRVPRTAGGLVQEVGRVLRVDPDNPDKVVGYVLDPLAQLPHMPTAPGSTLLTEAALTLIGDLCDEAADEAAAAAGPVVEPQRVIPPAVAVRTASRWSASLVEAAVLAGLVLDPVRGGQGPASDRQKAALARWGEKPRGPLSCLPPEARIVARAFAENPRALSAYAASAIMGVSIAAHRRWIETAKEAGHGGSPRWDKGWRWPEGIDTEPMPPGLLAALTSGEVAA